MRLAIAGFRHYHILWMYDSAKENPNVEIAGCLEEDAQHREATKKKYNIDFNYNTYDELLADKTVDAVAIGDYFAKRGQMVIKALKAGKHVIADRPICTDIKELDEIRKLVKDTGLTVSCRLDLRYMPQTERAKDIIGSGEIGKVINISFTGQHCLNYGARPRWYFEPGKQGGTINDIAIHGVDLVRYLTGKSVSKIDCARTYNAFADKEPDFKDCGMFMARMDDITLTADVSYAAPKFSGTLPTYWNFYFWGTDGMMNFNLADSRIHIYKDKEYIIECPDRKPDYLNDFLTDISGGKSIMETEGILDSQRDTLLLQMFADKYGE